MHLLNAKGAGRLLTGVVELAEVDGDLRALLAAVVQSAQLLHELHALQNNQPKRAGKRSEVSQPVTRGRPRAANDKHHDDPLTA